jgi:hypothetical protein
MNNMNNMNIMNISNEHLMLINILNTMYNDNNRQIHHLTEQNSRIINIITDILHIPSSSNNQNNTRQQSNRQQSNRQPNSRSVFLNNRQYIVDDIQRYEVPLSVVGTGIEGRIAGNYRDAVAEQDAVRAAARDAATRTASTYREHTQTERQGQNVNNVFSSLFQNFFDPVLIYPTNAQIETATRRVLYRDIAAPINNTCPISMENFNDNDTVTIIRHCGHIFNGDELNTWFESNCRCPVCRYDIRNYNRNTNSRSNEERNHNFTRDISNNILYTEDASGNYIYR